LLRLLLPLSLFRLGSLLRGASLGVLGALGALGAGALGAGVLGAGLSVRGDSTFGFRSSCAFATVANEAPIRSADASVNTLSLAFAELDFICCPPRAAPEQLDVYQRLKMGESICVKYSADQPAWLSHFRSRKKIYAAR